MPKTNIREFRHKVSVLKWKGLVPNTFDGRSVKPTPALKKSIRKFKDVLEGRAVAVKLPFAEIKRQQRAGGYIVAKPKGLPPRVLVTKLDPDEKIGVTHGRIYHKQPSGISYVELSIPLNRDIESYLKELAKNKDLINRMKRNDQKWAFNFFGHHSIATFSNIEFLTAHILRYHSVREAIEEHNMRSQREMVRNLAIVKIEDSQKWFARREQTKERQKKRDWKGFEKKRKERLHKRGYEYIRQLYNMRKAETQKLYRERIKVTDPAKYQKILEANAERSKKSRTKAAKAQVKAIKETRQAQALARKLLKKTRPK
jgi:hypothetical protein